MRCRRKKTSTHNLSTHWVTPINALTCVLWAQGQAVLLVFCIPSVGDQIPPRTQELPKLLEFTLWVQVTKAQLKQKGEILASCTSMDGEKLAFDTCRNRNSNTTRMPPPYSCSVCFHFFLSNWSSACRVCVLRWGGDGERMLVPESHSYYGLGNKEE